jgi:hypothetical protein
MVATFNQTAGDKFFPQTILNMTNESINKARILSDRDLESQRAHKATENNKSFASN